MECGSYSLEGGTMADIAEILKELQQERSRLDKAIGALETLLGQNHAKPAQGQTTKTRRTMSAAARRKIGLAQKARWAKAKGKDASTPVRTMSQAARKKIAAAQRTRWAKWKQKQGKKAA
jgi:hypothetical protein